MIVVEGPDGAGKTRLVQRLAEDLDLPIGRRVVSKDTEALVDLKVWTEANLAQGFHRMIYDRHRLISEFIYGPIIRRGFYQGFDDMAWLTTQINEFQRIDPVIIFCLPPIEVVWQNIKDDEDNQLIRDSIRAIYWAYWGAAAHWRADGFDTIFLWDYTADDRKYWMMQRSIEHILQKRIG